MYLLFLFFPISVFGDGIPAIYAIVFFTLHVLYHMQKKNELTDIWRYMMIELTLGNEMKWVTDSYIIRMKSEMFL